jgi:hypothetical protein
VAEDPADHRQTSGWDDFRRLVDDGVADARRARIVVFAAGLSDAELLRRVDYARRQGGHRHVRVRSDGGRFADARLTRAVQAAGADELHVCIPAHTAESYASITGRPEGFARLLAGLDSVCELGLTLVTCTVVCDRNVAHLAEIAELALRVHAAGIEFHNLVPRRGEEGRLLAPLADVQPTLQAALDRISASPATAVVTGFPRCLLGVHDAVFAAEEPNGSAPGTSPDSPSTGHCFYARACAWFAQCGGLSASYIQRFGWEIARLTPRERSPTSARAGADAGGSGPRVMPAASRWLELLSGADGEPLRRTPLWSLEGVSQQGAQVRYRFRLPNDEQYELVLEPRSDARRRHAQTAGFNVSLVPVGASSRRFVKRLLFTLLPILSRNDDGRLRLD